MDNRRIGQIARGLLVVLALALLPLAGLLQAPRPGVAQSTAQDSLWAGGGYSGSIEVCLSPGSPPALTSCFQTPSTTPLNGIVAVATDGVNVYFVSAKSGGLSCPIADLGFSCTHIMTGPWPLPPTSDQAGVWAIAVADGQMWIGQEDGQIYRCPSDIPYAEQSTVPDSCVLLADAGDLPVRSLLLANGRLYAGLESDFNKIQGVLWSCDPQAVNSCEILDSYGKTYAGSLAAGGGYLWAGLGNGIVWRCNLDTVNACDNWEQAKSAINSLSYDGQSILYAGTEGNRGVIWSCLTASANGCSNVVKQINVASVTAGDGSVFSGTEDGLYFGSSKFSKTKLQMSQVLYLPAGGPVGVGAAEVTVSAGKWGSKLDRRCDSRGKNPKATVTVRNGSGVVKSQKIGLCELRNAETVTRTFTLLDPGKHTVTARTKKYGGSRVFTVEQDETRKVAVRLTRKGAVK